MDDLDRKIVTTLQRDGRLPVTDLAERVGLSPTPCARRMARMEAEGIITGYAAASARKNWATPSPSSSSPNWNARAATRWKGSNAPSAASPRCWNAT
jgi:DeoR/GlpR family transcriptional regulator of sugar metabolism